MGKRKHYSIWILKVGVLLLIAPMCLAAGKVYKWTDKEGNVHYTQTPPPQQNAQSEEKISVNSSTATTQKPTGRKPPQELLKELNEHKTELLKRQTKIDQDKEKQIAAEKRCKAAKNRLLVIKQGGRMFSLKDNGERHYWDDKEREKHMAEAQQNISKLCK